MKGRADTYKLLTVVRSCRNAALSVGTTAATSAIQAGFSGGGGGGGGGGGKAPPSGGGGGGGGCSSMGSCCCWDTSVHPSMPNLHVPSQLYPCSQSWSDEPLPVHHDVQLLLLGCLSNLLIASPACTSITPWRRCPGRAGWPEMSAAKHLIYC